MGVLKDVVHRSSDQVKESIPLRTLSRRHDFDAAHGCIYYLHGNFNALLDLIDVSQ